MKKHYNLQTRIIAILARTERPHSVRSLMEQLGFEFNKTSVYRQLNRLFQEGKVHKIETTKETLYESKHSQHAHFRCIQCDIIQCFPLNVQILFQDVPELQEKQIIDITIDLKGMCAQCQQGSMV